MFSLEGMKLNQYDIESLISFDFTPVDNFDGMSTIEFLDVIMAGKNGSQLESSFSSITINTSDLLPNKTNLNSSYPNPFNPVTKISYDLANDGYVSIGIFDVLGRQVSELINKVQSKGNYDISWDAADQASGTYFIRMMADDKIMTEKKRLSGVYLLPNLITTGSLFSGFYSIKVLVNQSKYWTL